MQSMQQQKIGESILKKIAGQTGLGLKLNEWNQEKHHYS